MRGCAAHSYVFLCSLAIGVRPHPESNRHSGNPEPRTLSLSASPLDPSFRTACRAPPVRGQDRVHLSSREPFGRHTEPPLPGASGPRALSRRLVMPVRRLPVRPDSEQLHRQAKELLRAIHAGDPAGISDLREHHPAPIDPAAVKLADAQLVLARSYQAPSGASASLTAAGSM